jgi:single-strand selective monofunctional uracil DNA glycosylase
MTNETTSTADALGAAAKELCKKLRALRFAHPVHTVYNPLEYAWEAYSQYLNRFGASTKRAFFLGMNPGPWGMAQTGIPFGEVAAVKEFLNIQATIGKPKNEHPKRPIEGMECKRSEVSGKRLWGLFSAKYATPEAFFQQQFVSNYCPLVFMDEGGRNLTPDKLPAAEFAPLAKCCDAHLAQMLSILQPDYLVGIGQFAESCLERVAKSAGLEVSRISLPTTASLQGADVKTPTPGYPRVQLSRILHPSPASPAANRDWAGAAEKALFEAGVWKKKK